MTQNNKSYQICIPNKNSRFSNSYVAKQLASLYILGSSLIFANCSKESLIFRAWYLIALILSIWLSQSVCDNCLKDKLRLSYNISHLFVEVENFEYICWTTPKNDIALEDELPISHKTKFQ